MRPRAPALIAFVSFLSAGAANASTSPEKTRIAVVANIVNRAENDIELGSIAPFDEASNAASYAIDVAVVSGSEMLETKLGDQLRGCGADIRCISARLEQAGVARAVLVVADLGLAPGLVTARVVDAAQVRVVGTALVEVGGEGLRAAVKSAVTRAMEKAGMAIGGRLTIETSPANAEVQLGASKINAAPGLANIFVLPPGNYPVSAAHDGFVPTSTTAVVQLSRDTRVWMELQAEDSIFGSPWFWVALGGAAVIAGGAVVWAVRPGDGTRMLCESRDGTCEN